jgi:hypothetical protein
MPISEDDEADKRDERDKRDKRDKRDDDRIRMAERALRRGAEVSSGFVEESAHAPPKKPPPLPPSPPRQ